MKKKEEFLTTKERILFYRLKILLIEKFWLKYYLLTQVRITDLIKYKWNEIKHYWSLDFVICDFYNEMKPILAIELNWHEHSINPIRKFSDYRKKKILKTIWIPLIIIWNWELNDIEFLAEKLYQKILININLNEKRIS